jgi:hypothetical protein
MAYAQQSQKLEIGTKIIVNSKPKLTRDELELLQQKLDPFFSSYTIASD